jgi:hypothetical protein
MVRYDTAMGIDGAARLGLWNLCSGEGLGRIKKHCFCSVRLPSMIHDILLEASQSFFRRLKHIVLFADCESQVVFCIMRVLLRIEFRGRDSRDPKLYDQEPTEFEVPGPFGHMRWKFIVRW